MFLSIRGLGTAACVTCALLCAPLSAPLPAFAARTPESHAASAVGATSDVSVQDIMSAASLPPNFTGDDPEHVRDALAGHPSPAQAPSIASRVRAFLSHPFRRSPSAASATSGASQPGAQPDRRFVFVIPVSYGVRYLSKKKVLTVNVSLSTPQNPDAILLKQSVKGQSGRKLVVAPEAKEKGFIQTFDVIQLKPQESIKTTVRGRMLVPNFDPERGNSDFAILLICTLEPPYLMDDVEHSAPTDEEPTDITRRTSTLHGNVDAAWLIDRTDGTIVTKRLHLEK